MDLFLHWLDQIQSSPFVKITGRITEVTGILVRARLANQKMGDIVLIQNPSGDISPAEIVGFRQDECFLMPYGDIQSISAASTVVPTGRKLEIRCGEALQGCILNGLGNPIRGFHGRLEDLDLWPIDHSPPDPLKRQRITRTLPIGLRAVDALMSIGEGQRIGLFSGPGVGKSTLLAEIAKYSDAHINVICLVGERGREIREFIDDSLGPKGLERSVVICAGSHEPPIVRLKSALVATSIAEYFREKGKCVLLMLDSVTRLARAQREIGLASGEPPTRHGYPPSVFSMLSRLLERAGLGERGSITGIYAVLVAGQDIFEPVSDEVRSILDGHIVLSELLAQRNHWPAIDVLQSVSRLMHHIVPPEHNVNASRMRRLLSIYESRRELIAMGAYEKGSDDETDRAIEKIGLIEAFLKQPLGERSPYEDTIEALRRITQG